ncbi:hydroxyacid dehydrogenase [Candidatus Woesearchaeota archaeon]|nr:hydroxyacid dehydrogenase [Candidatus Woesearchaeota archaeon]MCF8012996.1 hydroxyacid dehydrogenase [Candidatus Woesearchaeota archaeon]
MKIAFFELEEWEKGYLAEKIHNQEVKYYTVPFNEVAYDEVKDIEIAVGFIYTKFTKEVIDSLPNLKMIATMSTGYDHIDTNYCKEKGIAVCTVPAYGDNTVAEHAFGLILNLSKNIHKGYVRTLQGDFTYDGLMGFDLKGKTLGVLGTGRIGQCSIKIAKGFGMNIVAYDAFPRESLTSELGFEYVSLDDLYKKADIITIHVPLLESTKHMINEEAISKMKKGVRIVNTSRGPIIDQEALIEGLQTGKIGGAGLDVLEGENLVKEEIDLVKSQSNLSNKQLRNIVQDHILMDMENVIVTPHLAFYTKEALQRILNVTLDNVFDCVEERGYKNQVNK